MGNHKLQGNRNTIKDETWEASPDVQIICRGLPSCVIHPYSKSGPPSTQARYVAKDNLELLFLRPLLPQWRITGMPAMTDYDFDVSLFTHLAIKVQYI